jgi:hypothetical protein
MFRVTTGFALLAICASANAAELRVTLKGTITNQTNPGYPELEDGFFQPPEYLIGVGDTVTFKGRINTDRVIGFGNGYSVAYFYDDTPGRVFDLKLGSYSWIPEHEYLDGTPDLTGIDDRSGTLPHLAGPSLLLKGSKVLGFAGWLIPTNSPVPLFDLGSDYMTGCYDPMGDCGGGPDWVVEDPTQMTVSSLFRVQALPGTYENRYVGASFNGQWDFAGSSAVIPEPSTWMMLILGFGVIGFAARRNRRSGSGEVQSTGPAPVG